MSEEKKLSRQRRWQLKKKAAGLCQICGKPGPGGFCEHHRAMTRRLALAYTRRKRCIPLDAPVISRRGRPRLYP